MNKVIGTATTATTATQVRGKAIAYWTVTLLFAASMTMSGIGQLLQWEGNLELVANLGYPVYVLTILGIWKVLGAIAIVVPGLARLKEWTYAGFFFLLTGAAFSHAFGSETGVDAFSIILPLVYAALNIASWALRPKSRTL
ncbi:DoxX family protein [Paenibacillus methanolicus]|uniref:DoxX-like protein n=1 Tax=Paenibacillus methanolicus TaxID=582686 RepID=A0A5S5C153_9BACL|nr:DoxX family protein [Paenibacillus methanolicus]TYP72060.1 DoxX-like protein [Paenibacillus methanolicus]